jgi:ferritin-like metal-binding protein YciE
MFVRVAAGYTITRFAGNSLAQPLALPVRDRFHDVVVDGSSQQSSGVCQAPRLAVARLRARVHNDESRRAMEKAEQKIGQYLNEAHASEQALVTVLQSQIAMTPRGSYRDGLETHVRETHDHATRVQRRLGELGHGSTPLQAGVGLVQSLIGQVLALGKTPLDLLRGTGGEEKVLKNAKDACATEALEIATYTAIEQMAGSLGDEGTAALARSIRADEQKMLDRILEEIPKLTDAVARSEIRGNGSYDISKTGAADAARAAGEKINETARAASSGAKRSARNARKVPGVARTEGQVKGALASEGDLAIAGYGKLTAGEIVEKLSDLSQVDLAKIDSYERRHESRKTILSRITSLRGEEPWPGYDELSVSEIRAVLDEGDEDRIRRVRSYERSHKNRTGVIDASERELARA